MPITRSRVQRVSLAPATAIAAATLSLVAQGPAPGAQPAPARRRNQHRRPRPRRELTAAAGRRPGGQGRGRGPSMMEPDFSKKPPVLPLTPAEEAKKFRLPPGFKIEPVLSDPDIEEPAQIAFDGNGRMFVLELRGYMQNADAAGELDPVGRISVHEDRDNDGVYETHKVFVDNLIFPRFVMPFGAERDPDEGVERRRGLEVHRHERRRHGRQEGAVRDRPRPAAERRAPGERLHLGRSTTGSTARSTRRASAGRRTASCASRPDRTAASGASTQDNYGKIWFQAGASGMPGYFQLPVAYGNFTYPRAVRARSEHHLGRAGAASPTCRAA